MTLIEQENKMVDDINALGDCFEQYSYLIARSADLPAMPIEKRRDECLVSGCQSKVWLIADTSDGYVHLEMDSDTLIIRGVLVLLLELFQGRRIEEICRTELSLFKRTELAATFDSGRNAGIQSVLHEITCSKDCLCAQDVVKLQ